MASTVNDGSYKTWEYNEWL